MVKTKPTLVALALLAGCVFFSGCMGAGKLTQTAKVMKNETTVLKANTPWGPQTFIGLNTNTTVIISPDGTLTINPPQLPTPGTTTLTTARPDNGSITVSPETELKVIRSGPAKQ